MSEYHPKHDEKRLQEVRNEWDRAASSFDNEPDHGLRDPVVLETWTRLFRAWMPSTRAAILDLGCGTGSLSVVLAGLGHTVTGIDLSPAMISLARAKAAVQGYPIEFQVMDAVFPWFARQSFDAMVCRHLLWALPEPKHVLQRWADLLQPKGRLFLIEGYWRTGAGLHANEIIEMLPSSFSHISTQDLSADPNYWGGPVTDERYAIIADLKR